MSPRLPPIRSLSPIEHARNTVVIVAASFWALIIFLALPSGPRAPEDFLAFYDAANAMSQGEPAIAFGRDLDYIYPPLIAWLFQPLTLLDPVPAARVWVVISWLLIPPSALLAAKAIDRAQRADRSPIDLAFIACFGIVVVGEKLLSELNYANTNLATIFAFSLSLYWIHNRPIAAGLVLGIALNFKYLPVAFLPWLIVRGQWRSLAGTAIGGLAGALLPATTAGLTNTTNYWRDALTGFAGMNNRQSPGANIHPTDWEQSISITSTMHRLLPDGATPAVLAIALACLALAWWIYTSQRRGLFIRKTQDQPLDLAELACLIIALLAFSPQTTGRHMNLALPAVIVFAAIATRSIHRPLRRLTIAACALAGLLLFLPPHDGAETASTLWKLIGGSSWAMLAMLYIAMTTAVSTKQATGRYSLGR